MISNSFNFQNLIVLDLANNHQGEKEHAKNIIKSLKKVKDNFNDFQYAIKFQFRDLPNFIRKNELENPKNKHINRFLSTKMTWDDFLKLKNFVLIMGF